MSKFFESSLASGQSALGKVNAPKAYKQSRQAISAAFMAAAGLGGALANLLKFDIVRDFAQTVALFFSGIASEGLELAKKTFGRVFGIISVDLNMVYDGINPFHIIMLLAVLAVILVIAIIIFYCMSRRLNPDEIRQGHEVVKWDERKEGEKCKVMFIQYTLLAATSLYLPVSRALAEAIRCGPRMIRILVQEDYLAVTEVIQSSIRCQNLAAALDDGLTDSDIINGENGGQNVKFEDCECTKWVAERYGTLRFVAIVVAIIFTVAFPFYCVWLIMKNKPYGSREDPNKCYDEEGHLVEYTDSRYREDLKNDPNQLNNPYLSLYNGYERKWAFYKVWVMGMKFILILPAIIWFSNPGGQSIVSMVVLSILAAFCFYSAPFLDPTDDILDGSGRVASVLTVLFSFLSQLGGATAMSTLVMVANGVNALIMLLALLWGVAAVRSIVKSITGQLQFSNSVTRVTGPASRVIPYWDIASELKRRIWHPFWEAVLLEEGEVYAKRLSDMQSKARDVGKQRVLEHWKNAADEEKNRVRERLMNDYEGVDVYYKAVSHDGHLDSKTCFGKMYIIAYPFHAVMVYDDSDDYTFIWEDSTKKLLEQNDNGETKRRRLVREKLRALCAPAFTSSPTLTYHLQRWEKHTVPDGTETYKDSKGNTRTRQKHATVSVLITYSKGNLYIGMNYNLEMQSGFKLSLKLTDGTGVATAPSTGQKHTINTTATLNREEVGIDNQFRECAALRQLFENSPNNQIWPEGLRKWQNKVKNYRERLLRKRCEEESILSSAFWLHIYDNDTATREEIEAYFKNFEARPRMKDIPARHKDGLDYLMNKMEWVNQHPCAAIWYVFFDDVWETNKEVGKIGKLQEELDPSEEDSIAFRPMKRPALETWLEERGLKSSHRWITPRILDYLYGLLDKTDEDYSNFDAEMQGADKTVEEKPKTGSHKDKERGEETKEVDTKRKEPQAEENAEKIENEDRETVSVDQDTGKPSGKEDGQEDTGETTKNESAKGKHIPSGFEFTPAVNCAYTVRRNTPTNKVVHESLHAMEQGKVKNLAMYGGGVYIPFDIDKVAKTKVEEESDDDTDSKDSE